MKIQIIGFSGAGKSTLSKQLSKFYDLPVIHMDSLNFLHNWVERDRTEFNNIVNNFFKLLRVRNNNRIRLHKI